MMRQNRTITAVIIDDEQTYTTIEVCELLNIPPALVLEMEEHGLFRYSKKQDAITHDALKRIEAACRIHRDLGVNLPGVVLALDLMKELDELRSTLAILERGIK